MLPPSTSHPRLAADRSRPPAVSTARRRARRARSPSSSIGTGASRSRAEAVVVMALLAGDFDARRHVLDRVVLPDARQSAQWHVRRARRGPVADDADHSHRRVPASRGKLDALRIDVDDRARPARRIAGAAAASSAAAREASARAIGLADELSAVAAAQPQQRRRAEQLLEQPAFSSSSARIASASSGPETTMRTRWQNGG